VTERIYLEHTFVRKPSNKLTRRIPHLIIGGVRIAHLEIEAIPQNWLSQMKAYQQIVKRLRTIDQCRRTSS
jgi:hypothetical protein